jgi:hypothetical protein
VRGAATPPRPGLLILLTSGVNDKEMKILFATEALKNECNNQDLLVRRLGAHRARLLRQRLDELFNAEVLADIRSLPHVGISGQAQGGGDLALDLGAPCKLVFRPAGPVPADGVWDWNKIDSINILALRGADAKFNP